MPKRYATIYTSLGKKSKHWKRKISKMKTSSDCLGSRILALLKKNKVSISDFAVIINTNPLDLETFLKHDRLPVYLAEKISKELRIPLYSMYTSQPVNDFAGKRYYTTNIWEQ